MTQDERALYWDALATLSDLIDNTPRAIAKRPEHVAAFSTALLAMHSQKASDRNIAILLYHVEHHPAYIFRDQYTLAALREAYKCVARVIEEEAKERAK